MKITTRQIVVTAAMVAVVILLSAPPLRLGFIPFVLGVAITIIHIPVIIGAIMEGPLVGLIIGLLFGLSSLMWSYLSPTGPSDLYFQNPLLSVLPRLFIGPVAYLVYRALRRPSVPWTLFFGGTFLGLAAVFCYQLAQANVMAALLVAGIALGAIAAFLYVALQKQAEVTAVAVAAAVGTLTNTVLVLTMLGVLSSLNWVSPPVPWEVLPAIALTNGIPEIVAAVFITVAVVAAWKQIEFGRKGSRILND
jgi:uncharacterized membrane protein